MATPLAFKRAALNIDIYLTASLIKIEKHALRYARSSNHNRLHFFEEEEPVNFDLSVKRNTLF